MAFVSRRRNAIRLDDYDVNRFAHESLKRESAEVTRYLKPPMPQDFTEGDRVAYSATFLRSTGNFTGRLPFLRGTVKETEAFGDTQLCVVKWDNYVVESSYHRDGFGRVISPNLILVSQMGMES